ncbi:MAG: hypothetical protein ACFFC6_05145 [Promethearchaeota archaeon]
MSTSEIRILKGLITEQKLYDLAELLTALREKSGKKWTLWGVNGQNLAGMYHQKVTVGYEVTQEDGSFTVESWTMFFDQVEDFLKDQLNILGERESG